VRTQVSVPDLLRLLGIRGERDGRKIKARCPNPAHPDSDPSWAIVDDVGSDKHAAHYCFSCGFGGGPWELAAAVRKTSIKEAALYLRIHLGNVERILGLPRVRMYRPKEDVEFQLPAGIQIPSLDQSEWFAPALEYLTRRGVERWQIDRWHIGFATRGRCSFRVVVPIHTHGRLVSYVARAFIDDGRPRYDVARENEPGARPELALFGEPGFDEGDVATVTEGVFGMLAMERAGAPNPCAILGAQNLCDEKIESLSRFKRLIVATDPDEAGDDAFELIRLKLCRYATIMRVRFEKAPDDLDVHELRSGIAGYA
jgi:DNA primase